MLSIEKKEARLWTIVFHAWNQSHGIEIFQLAPNDSAATENVLAADKRVEADSSPGQVGELTALIAFRIYSSPKFVQSKSSSTHHHMMWIETLD